MADPVYFRRLPIPRFERAEAARDRLSRQIEIHYRQREAAKARALAEGFPDVTADTSVEAPFATWDDAGRCPIHRFLVVEHERIAAFAIAADPLRTAHRETQREVSRAEDEARELVDEEALS